MNKESLIVEDYAGFLTKDQERLLTAITYPRWGFEKKPIIPIGIHEVKVYSVKGEVSRDNKLTMTIKIQLPPVSEFYRRVYNNRVSFEMLELKHYEAKVSTSSLGQSWFLPYTCCFDEAQLEQLKSFKGKKFKALIAHRQMEWIKDGYAVVGANDKPKTFFEPYIKAVYKVTDDISLCGRDYASLLETPFGYDVFN